MISCFDTKSACDEQRDRRTDRQILQLSICAVYHTVDKICSQLITTIRLENVNTAFVNTAMGAIRLGKKSTVSAPRIKSCWWGAILLLRDVYICCLLLYVCSCIVKFDGSSSRCSLRTLCNGFTKRRMKQCYIT